MLFITYSNILGDSGHIGIRKKVYAQIKIFAKNFGRVFYTVYCGQMMYLMSDSDVVEKEVALTRKECNQCILNWIDKYKITKTYIRYNMADEWFLSLLEEQKKRKVISVLEFPTIPYDGELSNKRIIAEDAYYRKKMAAYIDMCTTFGEFNEVFGIPCIPLLNGVDTGEHQLKKQRKADGNIVAIAVATMSKWHGYERFLEGMAEYYKDSTNRKIFFKLVGEGPETEKYKNIVRDNGLESYVEFCGKMEGKTLDMQYDEADIAVGTLGMYKIGIKQGSPIKLREYCVRGLPFIYGYDDTGLRGDEYFAMKVPNNDKKINMGQVLEFYDNVMAHENCPHEMRLYAENKYSWDLILKPVVDYFNNQVLE